MGAIEVLQKFLYPQPQSLLVTAMSYMFLGTLATIGVMELMGKHLQYSKFFNSNPTIPNKLQHFKLSSKVGMFVLYFPAFLFGFASLFVYPDEGLRFLLLRLALTIHFLKRVLEVLFVHKFHNSRVSLDSAALISLSYFLSTVIMIYAQHLSSELPEPSVDLKYPGVALFLLGIGGNFYHHYILATLRKEGEKEYKIPRGGLFNQVICAHYLFEVLGFVGISCIAQTVFSISFTAGTAVYLTGRSYATRKWYLSKFEDFPQNVKALIPFVF